MSVITRMLVVFWLVFGLAGSRTYASLLTIGPDGINSVNLTLADGVTRLDGAGIGIGQVEPGRPSKMGVDTLGDLHDSVNPTAVFRQDGTPTAADLIDTNPTDVDFFDHAMQVAGVMISTDPVAKGVAPGASLYSSTHATGSATGGTADDLTMRAIQQVATQPNVRAVNHSYFKLYPGTLKDGNDLLSAGLDWSAAKHNVLHITSGNNLGTLGAGFSPKANFNGMVIGSSFRPQNTGKYRRYDGPTNQIITLEGTRTAIDLLAPGVDVQSTLPNNMITPFDPSDLSIGDDGTSFAAAHVTATIALLQQYGDDRVMDGAPNWTGMAASGPTS